MNGNPKLQEKDVDRRDNDKPDVSGLETERHDGETEVVILDNTPDNDDLLRILVDIMDADKKLVTVIIKSN